MPANAIAAAITVTVTNTVGLGFASAYPAGIARPEISVLNYLAAQTRANGTIVQLASGGAIDVFTSSAADVVIDVSGYFTPSSAATVGRFVSFGPTRVLDTRGTSANLRCR